MVLYLIGLGLGNADDITVKGLKLVQSADVVFLEAYTSILVATMQDQNNDGNSDNDDIEKQQQQVLDMNAMTRQLQEAYGITVPIVVADRELVESRAEDEILQPALLGKKVAFLVVGDPVCATTHSDLYLRARELRIETVIVHNASIMGGVTAGATGLQLYKFGQTVSIPFFDGEKWKPTSFYPKLAYNRAGGLHTLCLLDIKVKEPDYDALIKTGRANQYLPPRFMTVATAAQQLAEVETRLVPTAERGAYDVNKTLCIGLARMGQAKHQAIVAGTLMELQSKAARDILGGPLHSMIVCGELHDLELQVLQDYILPNSTYDPQHHHQAQKNSNARLMQQSSPPPASQPTDPPTPTTKSDTTVTACGVDDGEQFTTVYIRDAAAAQDTKTQEDAASSSPSPTTPSTSSPEIPNRGVTTSGQNEQATASTPTGPAAGGIVADSTATVATAVEEEAAPALIPIVQDLDEEEGPSDED